MKNFKPVTIMDVPTEVKAHVKEYFKQYLPQYEVRAVYRYSNHPQDSYLYQVVARKDITTYAAWTCWNEDRQTLAFGRYDLPRNAAFRTVKSQFKDIYAMTDKRAEQESIRLGGIALYVLKDDGLPVVSTPVINHKLNNTVVKKYFIGVDVTDMDIPFINIKQILKRQAWSCLPKLYDLAVNLQYEPHTKSVLESIMWECATCGDEARAIAIREIKYELFGNEEE